MNTYERGIVEKIAQGGLFFLGGIQGQFFPEAVFADVENAHVAPEIEAGEGVRYQG